MPFAATLKRRNPAMTTAANVATERRATAIIFSFMTGPFITQFSPIGNLLLHGAGCGLWTALFTTIEKPERERARRQQAPATTCVGGWQSWTLSPGGQRPFPFIRVWGGGGEWVAAWEWGSICRQ